MPLGDIGRDWEDLGPKSKHCVMLGKRKASPSYSFFLLWGNEFLLVLLSAMMNMTRAQSQWGQRSLSSVLKRNIQIYTVLNEVQFSFLGDITVKHAKHMNLFRNSIATAKALCKTTVLLKEFQDELLKILEVCSNEKIVLIRIHMTQHVTWSCIIRSQYQVSHAKNYAKIDSEITLFLRQISSLLSNCPDLNIQWKVLLVIMMLTSLKNLY